MRRLDRGFVGYSRKSEPTASISTLHQLIQGQVQDHLGDDFELFFDSSGIEPGDEWERTILTRVEESTFYLPMLTPWFFTRPWCIREAELFLDRWERGDHRTFIFPVYLLAEEHLDDEDLRELHTFHQRLHRIERIQWCDLRAHRHNGWNTPDAKRDVDRLAAVIAAKVRELRREEQFTAKAGELLRAGKLAEAATLLRKAKLPTLADRIGRLAAAVEAGDWASARLVWGDGAPFDAETSQAVDRRIAEGQQKRAPPRSVSQRIRDLASRVEAGGPKQQAHPAPPAEPAAGTRTVVRLDGVPIELAYIPAGTFRMGSPARVGDADERPQHQVTITRPFRMGVYAVTQAQWASVAKAAGLEPDLSLFKDPTHPVEQVSWREVVRWCNAASAAANLIPAYTAKGLVVPGATGFRLPTEAEWEYACRAGTTTRWSFGEERARLIEHAWFGADDGTHPVGEKLPNPWGLHDVHGNVLEWCTDDVRSYEADPMVDPVGAGADRRVVRGGSWGLAAGNCRSAFRVSWLPDERESYLGFRVVLAAPEP